MQALGSARRQPASYRQLSFHQHGTGLGNVTVPGLAQLSPSCLQAPLAALGGRRRSGHCCIPAAMRPAAPLRLQGLEIRTDTVSLGRGSHLYPCLVWIQNPPRHPRPGGAQQRGGERSRAEPHGASRRDPSGAVGSRLQRSSPAALSAAPARPQGPELPRTAQPTPPACGAECGRGAAWPSLPGLLVSQLTSRLLSRPNSSFRIINSSSRAKAACPAGPGTLALAAC